MKKQLALAAALGMIAMAPAAHAGIFGGVFDRLSSAAKNLIPGAINKGAEMAQKLATQGIDMARSTATNVVQRLENGAKELLSKGHPKLAEVLNGWGERLKTHLPSSLAPLVDQGVKLGQGGLNRIVGALNGAIGRGGDWARTQLANLDRVARNQVASMISNVQQQMLQRVNGTVDQIRRVVEGRVERVAGWVTSRFNGLGQSIAGRFLGVLRGR